MCRAPKCGSLGKAEKFGIFAGNIMTSVMASSSRHPGVLGSVELTNRDARNSGDPYVRARMGESRNKSNKQGPGG